MSRDSDSPGTEFKVAAAGPLVTLVITLVCAGARRRGRRVRRASGMRSGRPERRHLRPLAPARLAGVRSTRSCSSSTCCPPSRSTAGGSSARSLGGSPATATARPALPPSSAAASLTLFIALRPPARAGRRPVHGIWLALIGFILGQSARGYAVQSEVSSRIEGIRVADVMDAEPVAIPEDASVERALDEYFLRYRWPWFPVVDSADRFRGCWSARPPIGVPGRASASATCSRSIRAARCGCATTPRSSRCSATTRCAASAAWPRSTPTAGSGRDHRRPGRPGAARRALARPDRRALMAERVQGPLDRRWRHPRHHPGARPRRDRATAPASRPRAVRPDRRAPRPAGSSPARSPSPTPFRPSGWSTSMCRRARRSSRARSLQRIHSVEGLVDEKYDDDGLEEALTRYLGDARLRDTVTDVLIPSYDTERRRPEFFKSARAREEPDRDFALRAVARATAVGADLLRAGAARRPAADRRRRVRRQPRDVRGRRGDALLAGRRDRPRLARHRPADPPVPLRRGQGLGPDRVGPAR